MVRIFHTKIKEGPIDGTNQKTINVQPDQLTVEPKKFVVRPIDGPTEDVDSAA